MSLKWTNCIEYTMYKWVDGGGYFLIRKSKYGWYPHFLHIVDLDFKKNKNIDHVGPESDGPATGPIDLICFGAKVKSGDD